MVANKTGISILLLTATLGCVAIAAQVEAAPTVPTEEETAPSARRMAARALQRSRSTEWPVDVAARLRLLEEHAERAAREREATVEKRSPR